MDLSFDQQTLFYTSEGSQVKRFNVATSTQLADFSNVGGTEFAFRLLSGRIRLVRIVKVERLVGAVPRVVEVPECGQLRRRHFTRERVGICTDRCCCVIW